VPAAATAHAGEAVLQDAAGQELLDHGGDDAPPRAPAVGEALVVVRREGLEVEDSAPQFDAPVPRPYYTRPGLTTLFPMPKCRTLTSRAGGDG
jgi:hypothetical protein